MPNNNDAYEHDVFISFTHVDNLPPLAGRSGWITDFHKNLSNRLWQLLGVKPAVWRDSRLQGNDVLDDAVIGQLPKTRALVTVVSPRYLFSEWCQRELAEFHAAAGASGGLKVEDKLRIFKVIKTLVPLKGQPALLQDVLGYEFLLDDPVKERKRELDPLLGGEEERQYLRKLDDLAHDIGDLLERMSGRQPVTKGYVYVAETSADLRQQRDAVRRNLQRQGYGILPYRPLPQLADELDVFVREQLAQCRLSVHLIGRNYGVVPDGAEQSVVVLQQRIAAELCSAERPQLLWLADTSVEDQRQQQFVDELRGEDLPETADLLEKKSLEELHSAIEKTLEHQEKAERQKDDGGGEGINDQTRSVYLICGEDDLDAIDPLADYLDERGFEVEQLDFEDDEAQRQQDHKNYLRECDTFLIYFGAGNAGWCKRMLSEIKRSPGEGRKRPILARAVYVAPSRHQDKLRTQELRIEGTEPFDGAVLKPFLEDIQAANVRKAG